MARGGPSAPSFPLVVAGMHRSGTSLAASWIGAAGIDLGERLIPADAANPRGYFEDAAFVELHGRMLRAATREDDGGHRDWGWTESERLDRQRFAPFRDPARELLERRAAGGRPWGWKDPRTTLALDFWDELTGGAARYLLVYRVPWDVADSMQRLGADVFLEHPEYAYRIWTFYNRQLLDFHRRHRERSLLLSADALFNRPLDAGFAALVAGRLGLATAPLEALVGRGLFRRTGRSDPLAGLIAATHPECIALLSELDAAADLTGSGLWSASPPSGARLDGGNLARRIDLSIVIPCHDDGELLIEAVASAERSAPEATELLVVNDGSREASTLAFLEVLRRAGYRIIDQESSGLAAARNRGIREARGRYLLPLDADNRLRPELPAAAISVLDAAPGVGVVYGDRQEFGWRSRRVEVPELDLDGLLCANYIDACAVLRREVWEQCGGYDGAMPAMGWEDWDLWLGAAERGWGFHRVPGITFDYRVRPGSMASSLLRAEVGEPLRTYIFDKHLDLYRRRLPVLLTKQHDAAAAQAAAADAERKRLEVERDNLYAELASWRRRVAFMEGTRAWRLRRWLLGLRQRSKD